MLIDKPTKIKIVKEHLNDRITLKELKEKYVISNDHIKYMIALYKRHGEEAFHDKIQKYGYGVQSRQPDPEHTMEV